MIRETSNAVQGKKVSSQKSYVVIHAEAQKQLLVEYHLNIIVIQSTFEELSSKRGVTHLCDELA